MSFLLNFFMFITLIEDGRCWILKEDIFFYYSNTWKCCTSLIVTFKQCCYKIASIPSNKMNLAPTVWLWRTPSLLLSTDSNDRIWLDKLNVAPPLTNRNKFRYTGPVRLFPLYNSRDRAPDRAYWKSAGLVHLRS